MVNYKAIPNSVYVGLTLIVFIVMMFIVMTATTEADSGFHTSSEENQSMSDHYAHCPLNKALLDDASSAQNIREVIEIEDVSCDKSSGEESLTVKFIGDDTDLSKQKFVEWLKRNGLNGKETIHIDVATESSSDL